jgi:hypothetical protein
MKHGKFVFDSGEKKSYIVPDVFWQRGNSRKIRLLLTGERMVLLTRENLSHFLAVSLLGVIAVVIIFFLLKFLHLQDSVLPLILMVIFAVGGNIHLLYRFRNPRLHRMIRSVPLSQITQVEKVSDVRLVVHASGNRKFVFIMTPGSLREFAEKLEQNIEKQ